MKYDVVILDNICCSSYVDWTYEDESTAPGRDGLLRLQLESAMCVGKGDLPVIAITSCAKAILENKYCNDERGMCHVSSLVESALLLNLENLSDEEAVLKIASLFHWKKIKYCVLTGNALLFEKARKSSLNVLALTDSNSLF